MNRLISKAARTAINIFGSGLSQDETERANIPYDVPSYAKKLMRTIAADGTVLLKNDGVLPLKGKIAVFGRCQIDWFCCGYGSGGNVNAPYKTNLYKALESNEKVIVNQDIAAFYKKYIEKHPADEGFWGHWPFSFPEPVVPSELIKSASIISDTAVMVIGRAAGEDRENKLTKGSYYLTDNEIKMLDLLTSAFTKTVVVLNCGNIIDMYKLDSYGDRISAILLAFHGGMEGGNAAADVLTGKTNPSGKLTDTIAKYYADYPSAKSFGGREYNEYADDIYVGYRYFETFAQGSVLYPFGFGLSYAEFSCECTDFSFDGSKVTVRAAVTNTGKAAGKYTVQLYCEQPDGKLKTPFRILCGFDKTDLLNAGEKQTVEFSVPLYAVSCYYEEKAAYIIQSGEYRFVLSDSARGGTEAGKIKLKEKLVKQHEHVCAPKASFKTVDGTITNTFRTDIKSRILDRLPEEIRRTADKGYTLSDVKSGDVSLNDFIAQLNDDELEALTRGDFIMNSPLGANGNAGVFGGITESLRAKGVPPLTCTDGPAGIRLYAMRSLLPTGACIAASWDTALTEELYSFVASEMTEAGSDILLAPGMNIHRNPLCGRNFEYFSEDPFLTGKIASAAIRGIQSQGGAACPKHFACNNQESNRNINDSRVSERALREIYLKSFEIAVKEAKPKCIMTSYNKINSVYNYNNYDLATTVLRGEWNYDGCVMTDWWVKHTVSRDFPLLRDSAHRVRAQVDVLMPGINGRNIFRKKFRNDGTLFESVGADGGLTLAEIQRTAKNVLRLCLNIKK